MDLLLHPHKDAVFYEDNKLYVCLASFPITKGHSIIVWKDKVDDLHFLNDEEYDYLMDKVDTIRDALIKVLGVEKVYLIYMDEAKQVHWHLIPRYDEKGFNLFTHEPKEIKNFSLAKELRSAI